MDKAHFQVDPRLASLLGENYRSTDQAIRELVDNAWDADAENVRISLPAHFTDQPIVITDDGCGMTEEELRSDYLVIAHDRRTRKGEKTPIKGRLVRGRKGIGKFAGLVTAQLMRVETWAQGEASVLEIERSMLQGSSHDLENIELPLSVSPCESNDHGTTVTLSQLNPRLSLPTPEALMELLALEFGRFGGFAITVNGEALTHEAIQGESFTRSVELPGAGKVSIRFTIMDSPRGARHAGIVTRVGGKIVGRPSFFGLDTDDDIPRKLLNRLVGEIEADGLEGDVTADWGALFENSTGYQNVQRMARDELKASVNAVFHKELNLVKARRQRKVDQLLAKLPENRREFASKAFGRVMRRFYAESDEKFDVLISLILEAFERDEYWTVCNKIEDAERADVVTMADALQEFGLVDLAYMGYQARRRLQFLDHADALAREESTLESTMHKALETNLWVFGSEYVTMSSNKTLAKTIEEYTGKKFTGPTADHRHDLFLAQNVLGKYLLIEFKRPSHTLNRDDENQAEKYRDDLTPHFDVMDILVIGGKKSPKVLAQYQRSDIKMFTYEAIFSSARTQLNWLLSQLTSSS